MTLTVSNSIYKTLNQLQRVTVPTLRCWQGARMEVEHSFQLPRVKIWSYLNTVWLITVCTFVWVFASLFVLTFIVSFSQKKLHQPTLTAIWEVNVVYKDCIQTGFISYQLIKMGCGTRAPACLIKSKILSETWKKYQTEALCCRQDAFANRKLPPEIFLGHLL